MTPLLQKEGAIMSEVSEAIEKAEEGEHAEFFNKRIALVIAILALFLSFSETLAKGAQNEATNLNIRASDLYAFFQAKTIRMTTVTTAAEELAVTAAATGDAAAKDAAQKQIDAWKKSAERYDSDEKSREGRKELVERAKDTEAERDVALAKYHHYELASAAFQIGIVLASAAVITGMVALVWFGGLLGVIGAVLMVLGIWAPHAVPFIATL
jgi:cytochrome c biogenesis factor